MTVRFGQGSPHRMIAFANTLLGVGIYTPEEAARYARISSKTMSRWIFGDGSGEAVIDAQLKSEKLVTFLDFVQALAIRSVRLSDKKFPLQKIRKACELATEKWKVKHPLAAKNHRIYLFGPRDNLSLCEIIVSIGHDDAGDEAYYQVTGKKAGNRMITKIAEPFMRGLKFGDSDYAEEYTAWSHGNYSIVMDPHKRFGEPFLPSCGYTAIALWEAYKSEGGVEAAAEAYDVSTQEVELACSYFDYLTGNDAA